MSRYRRSVSIGWPRSYEPRALSCCATPVCCSSALMHQCDVMMRYRQQVSILWPSAYKAITIFKFGHLHVMLIEDGVLDALPLSYTGMLLKFFVTCAMTTSFCKVGEGLYTDNPFRSSVLVVMSHARCLCAMSVSMWRNYLPLQFSFCAFFLCWRGKFTTIFAGFELRNYVS